MQQRIYYRDIIALGFKEQFVDDPVYVSEYGFDYVITDLKLSKHFYIDWAKETGFCELIEVHKGSITKRVPIRDLDHLKDIIQIFK